jgi:hypothetical protein
MKLTWSWWRIFLMFCWIQLASILLRSFASIFIKDIWPVGFWNEYNTSFMEWVW